MPRVPPTLVDDPGATVIARFLKRSRGVPLFFRFIADIVRLTLVAGLALVAWPRIAPVAARLVPASVPEEHHAHVLGALLFLSTMILAVVLFRITTKRFAQPLRSRGS
ncbi:MAG TPA: hypothetical protein VFB62_06820 [Polyangiaceae bacterium]|jgi:hypothetical protein|nr:hypothetical protein [Polyangiaceae bacterium]